MKSIPENRSYTFIELICVIIIIGILAGTAIPLFKKAYTDLQFNSTVQEMYSFMNYLRGRARSEQVTIRLYLAADNSEYWAEVEGSRQRLRTVHIPGGIALESDKEIIGFYPDGKIDKADIKFIAPPEKEITVTTKGVFGGVKIVYEK